MISENIRRDNALLLRQLSLYLNLMPRAVDGEMVKSIAGENSSKENKEYAFAALLAAYCGLDTENNPRHKALFHDRFTRMIHIQSVSDFVNDAYYANIKVPDVVKSEWELKHEVFKPFEAFIADETQILPDGKLLPNIGFFEEEFTFPAALQDGREWMTVTPHEIRTTLPAVNKSHGKVATYGLGLGYFAYMASMKKDVQSVTVVEKDGKVKELFEKYLLPMFPNREKIHVVCRDAFDYAENTAPSEKFDFVFADTWHDPSDGVEMYKKFKSLELLCRDTEFMYWIEATLKYYMSLTEEDSVPLFTKGFDLKLSEK